MMKRISKVWLSGFMDGKGTFGVGYQHVTDSPNLLIPYRPQFFFKLAIVKEKVLMGKIGSYLRKNTGAKVVLSSATSKDWGPNAQVQYMLRCTRRDDIYDLVKFFIPLLRSRLKIEAEKMLAIIEYHRKYKKILSRDLNVFLTFARMVDDMREHRPSRGRKYTYNYFLENYGGVRGAHTPIESLNKVKN